MRFILGELHFEDIIAGGMFLILVFIVVNNWRGANAILATTVRGTVTLTRSLQGR